MKHNVAGRKLGRRSSHREAMLQNLVGSLYRWGRVTTTVEKAKEARSMADHLITVARRGDLSARRYVLRFLTEKDVIKKLFDEICKWNPGRTSGHTRILRVGWRKGDAAEMALFELVDHPKKEKKEEKGKDKGEGKKKKEKEKKEPVPAAEKKEKKEKAAPAKA